MTGIQQAKAKTSVLVLGCTGMLGHKLCQGFQNAFDTHGTVRHSLPQAYNRLFNATTIHNGVDARRIQTVEEIVDRVNPAVVINCIGLVKQIPEASDPVQAITVNALFPRQLAATCRQRGVRLIHISTDCVFSGKHGKRTEVDTPDAEDLYGRTKLLGEIEGNGCLTLRTSIIGREVRGQHGLLEWFLAQGGKTIQGYRNAVFSGLTTLELTRIVQELIIHHSGLDGLYHVAAESISKFELLERLQDAYEIDLTILPDESYSCDRSLDGARFHAVSGLNVSSWNAMIARMVSDRTPYDRVRTL